jgi:hypothetical protein
VFGDLWDFEEVPWLDSEGVLSDGLVAGKGNDAGTLFDPYEIRRAQ